VIAVRVLRDGVPVREAVFRHLPVTLGRAPESDLVLFDASVSRAHARLEQDEEGRVWLRDLGSRNQVFQDGGALREVAVLGPTRLWLGRVELEIEPLRLEDTIEVPAPERPHPERRRGFLHQLAYLGLGILGLLAYTLTSAEFWSPLAEDRGLQLGVAALLGVVLLPLGAISLLIVLKALGRGLRATDTLLALARVVWLIPLVALFGLLAYYFLSPTGRGLVMAGTTTLAVAAAAGAVASVRRPGPNTRFRLAWGAVAVLLLAAIGAATHSSAEHSGAPSVDYDAQPPLFGFTGPKVDVDAHLLRVKMGAESAAADAEAARARRHIE
jgi:hypothetical protein